MDKKNYTLSKVIDFLTNGEDSSSIDSDEEEEIRRDCDITTY